MKRLIFVAVAAMAIAGIDPASAADASFGCEARAGQTCFFKLFLGPRATRVVQLVSGMKVNVPGVDVGRDHYCMDLAGPPASLRCQHKLISAGYNH